MSTDAQNTYIDARALSVATGGDTTTSIVGDIIDHGTGGAGLSHGMFLEIVVTGTFVGPSTAAVFLLQQDNDAAFGSPTTIGTYTASTALAPAGEYIAQVAMPTVTERYTRVSGSWSTAATGTVGAVSAYLTDSPQKTWSGV